MTFEEFDKYITVLKNFNSLVSDFENDIGKYCDSVPIFEFQNNLVNSYLKMLETLMSDTSQWIDWWIWENNYGENGLYAFIDKRRVKLETTKQFYNFLIKEKKRNEKCNN